jgi:hypothetical protein
MAIFVEALRKGHLSTKGYWERTSSATCEFISGKI